MLTEQLGSFTIVKAVQNSEQLLAFITPLFVIIAILAVASVIIHKIIENHCIKVETNFCNESAYEKSWLIHSIIGLSIIGYALLVASFFITFCDEYSYIISCSDSEVVSGISSEFDEVTAIGGNQYIVTCKADSHLNNILLEKSIDDNAKTYERFPNILRRFPMLVIICIFVMSILLSIFAVTIIFWR